MLVAIYDGKQTVTAFVLPYTLSIDNLLWLRFYQRRLAH